MIDFGSAFLASNAQALPCVWMKPGCMNEDTCCWFQYTTANFPCDIFVVLLYDVSCRTALASSSSARFMLFLALVLLIDAKATREEKYLKEKFGKAWDQYTEDVKKILPFLYWVTYLVMVICMIIYAITSHDIYHHWTNTINKLLYAFYWMPCYFILDFSENCMLH